MSFQTQLVNRNFGVIHSTDLNTPPLLQRFGTPRKEVLKIGVDQIEANLLYAGVERGKILNIDVFDFFYHRSICFFTSKIAETGKKIAVVFDDVQYSKMTPSIQKYVKPNVSETFHPNIAFWGADQNIAAILGKAKKESFDFLLLCDFWHHSNENRKVKNLADAVSKTDIAVLTLSQIKTPSWVTNYRDKKYPALETLDAHCQCNILIRPALSVENHCQNEKILEDFRIKARASGSGKIQSQMLFSQKAETGEIFRDTLDCAFARGYLDRPHTLLGFSFEPQNNYGDFCDSIKVSTLC